MRKAEKIVNNLMIVLGIMLLIEGAYSFDSGLQMPLWEFLLQCVIATALIRIGAGRMINL